MSVEIPEYIAQKFQNLEDENNAELSIDSPLNNSGDTLQELQNFSKWASNTLDDFAKGAGYPGLGQVPPDKLGELLGSWADKRLPDYIKTKTEDATLLTLLGSIAWMNYSHYRRQQIKDLKDKKQGADEEI